jgi:hypothetical protein
MAYLRDEFNYRHLLPQKPSPIPNDETVAKLCRRCGAAFLGTRITKRCDVCRDIVKEKRKRKSSEKLKEQRKQKRLARKAGQLAGPKKIAGSILTRGRKR